MRSSRHIRFSAKLLFQFRVIVDGKAGKRRKCEERIITLMAKEPKQALAMVQKNAKAAQFKYKNVEGNPVHFEFVGILELISLDPECEPNEVWYEILEKDEPMERRKRLVPPTSQLRVFRNLR